MSSTILTVIVLVVMWVVVLVPMMVRRDMLDDEEMHQPDISTPLPARLLSRSLRLDPRRAEAVPPDDPGCADRGYGRSTRRASRVEMLIRRRRTLAALASLAALSLLAATTLAPAWWAVQTGLDLMLTGYLVWLRAEARRAAEHRRAREALMHAGRTVTVSGADARPATPVVPRPAARSTIAAQVVPLDDDDLSFVDIEERYPRAANG
ncbi:MAG: hypothetical protein HYR62_05500 [Actinobacteria bacterium]|nr:hypothetical protein [Actinomycetota bacterium]MBI3688496.1 hypothetical protein [Actinomycetota bacterium]